MAAAPKLDIPRPPAPRRRAAAAPTARNRSPQRPPASAISAKPPARSAVRPGAKSVKALAVPPKPQWLTALLLLQRTSSTLTFGLAIAVLVVYSWTVYTQQRWGQSYSKLEALQKQERQLIAANEVLKSQMAQRAEDAGTGLVFPEPSSRIFMSPAPLRPAARPEVDLPLPQPIPSKPLGY